MSKVLRQKNRFRIYVPQRIADAVGWSENLELSGEIGRDGELVLVHDPNSFPARFFSSANYNLITIPVGPDAEYKRRVKLEPVGDKLLIKFF